MIPELWSVNRLACELAMDRRSLARKLEGLEPVESKKTGKGVDRLFRLADVIAHLADPGGDGALDLAQERAKLAKLQQQKLELELAEVRGEICRVPVVVAYWQAMVASMRAVLLQLPSRVAARVAPEHQGAVLQMATAEVYTSLNAIADDGLPAEVVSRIVRTAHPEGEPEDSATHA